MREPDVVQSSNADAGFWRIYARPFGVAPVDITVVRGAPTEIVSMSSDDPFGPTEATLMFPAITMLDTYGRGAGDLEWLRPEVDIDICWEPINPKTLRGGPSTTLPILKRSEMDPEDREAYDRYYRVAAPFRGRYAWEGYAVDFGWSFAEASGSLTLQLKGAMYQLDNYLAMPEFLSRPITFEHAIIRQFRNKPGLRVTYPSIRWPSWWSKRYMSKDYDGKEWFLRPSGVFDGNPWSGMLTRETGQREEALSSYIQGLLSAMYTERGQWTMMLDGGRVPVILHREHRVDPESADLVVDLLQPGLSLELNQDYTQRANVVYGRGRSLAGVTFSGMQVTPTGNRTYYEPFASMSSVHPDDLDSNPRRSAEVMRREINLDFYEGMSAEDARRVAQGHLMRFSDPGVVGSLDFTASDPTRRLDGSIFPRQLITAGMNIRVDGLFGRRPGPVLHIAKAEVSPANDSASLTVDTRFRDALTVQEVEQRGRDSLQVARMLTVGQYSPNIPDQLLPWDYALGSGAIPLGSKNYFDGAPSSLAFPWVDWVEKHPPKDYPWAFIKIGPTSYGDAGVNWNRPNAKTDATIAPLLLSQAGEVKLIQVAAFRADGSLCRVGFHLSIYADYAASALDAPALTDDYSPGGGKNFFEGQPYPFFQNAWERVNSEGEQFSDPMQVEAEGTGLTVGYGTYYAKAGYWPKAYSQAEYPTGLLVDESGFSYDGSQHPDFDLNERSNNTFEESGRFGVLVYCDDQGAEPVYFLGRAWHREYGTS